MRLSRPRSRRPEKALTASCGMGAAYAGFWPTAVLAFKIPRSALSRILLFSRFGNKHSTKLELFRSEVRVRGVE